LQQDDPRKGFVEDEEIYGGDDAYDDDGNVNLCLKELLIRRVSF